jgi:hypothetical protein
VAALTDPHGRRHFAWQLILGLPRLSVTLCGRNRCDRYATAPYRARASRVTGCGLKLLYWVVRSETRPWAALAMLVAWIVLQTVRANPGDAVATLITIPPVLATGIKWLRTRLGVTQDHPGNRDKSQP